jgi:N-acetylmuramoyl-L-alanine amidase
MYFGSLYRHRVSAVFALVARPMSRASAKRLKSRRNVLVIAGLLSSLTLTSILLLILAPSPLLPEARSLMVVESNPTLDEIFDTQRPIQNGRWQSIFIHHSRTRRADGAGGDHFVISGPADAADGEIRIDPRWNTQQAAAPRAGAAGSNCITICIVGDFDQSAPTATQIRRAQQLIATLQRRLRISARNVIAYDRPGSPAGLGRQFPSARLREALVP